MDHNQIKSHLFVVVDSDNNWRTESVSVIIQSKLHCHVNVLDFSPTDLSVRRNVV